MARWIVEIFLATLVFFCGYLYSQECKAQVPAEAARYRAELVKASQLVWGLDAPIPVFAGQITQESGWDAAICSPYACGLTQFTPATAEWIQRMYGVELGRMDRFDPKWAIRAMVRYDYYLYSRVGATPCDSMWMALWGYNGGEGWRKRDQAKAQRAGADPLKAREVEPFNAGRSAAAFKENRGYPRKILLLHQPRFVGWGRMLCLQG